MVGFLCALSVFRIANQTIGRDFYALSVLSTSTDPVTASAGISVVPDSSLERHLKFDLVFVCAGPNPRAHYSKPIGAWLRWMARNGSVLGAISTGSDLLARAGLLEGRRCTIYWEQAAAFAEEFPDIILTDSIYEIDGDRVTCGGATSAIDLCHRLVAEDLGPEIAATVSSAFVLDRVRNAEEPQKRTQTSSIRTLPRKLAKAIAAMEANYEDPLAIGDVARAADVGPRHLSRLFRQFLQTTPAEYYLRLRLTRARQLILQTSMTAQEVALACGFRSASHFSVAYRRQFGHGPRVDRLRSE